MRRSLDFGLLELSTLNFELGTDPCLDESLGDFKPIKAETSKYKVQSSKFI